MRILFVSTVMAAQTHGPSRKLMLLRESLAEQDAVELRVLTENPHPSYPDDYAITIRYPQSLEPLSKLIRGLRYWREARAIYREWAYDVLVFNDAPKALFAARATRLPGVCLVAMLNDDDNVDRGFRQNERYRKWLWRRAMGWIEREVCRGADRVIVCSHYLAERVRDGYGLSELPSVLHPSLKLEEWAHVRANTAAAKPALLFVKSDPIRGGVLDLLAAVATEAIVDTFDVLHLAGFTPEDYPQIVRAAAGLACRVEMHGRVSREQLCDLIARSHIGVVASRHEAFGITAQEFAVTGLQTVVSRTGGLPEACRGYEVHFCEPGDPLSLRDALLRAVATVHQPMLPQNRNQATYGHREMAVRFLALLHPAGP